MATFYMCNTVRFRGPHGPVLVKAGSLINDAQINTTQLQAAGGVIASTADTTIAAAAVIAQKRRKQGASVHELDAIMLGAASKQLGLT
jgi:hypothetical protein